MTITSFYRETVALWANKTDWIDDFITPKQGKYTNGSGSASCEECPAGRYNDKSAQNNKTLACKLCPEGRYGDKPGAYSCTVPCPKGSYSRPGATECILCPPGRYNDVAGYGVLDFKTFVCKMCNIGNYEAPRGSTCCQK